MPDELVPHIAEIVQRLLERDGNVNVTRHYENTRLPKALGVKGESMFTVRIDRKWRLVYRWKNGLQVDAIVDRGDKQFFRREGY